MASLTVSGIVRITRDPETRPGQSGTWYSFGIAAYRKDVLEGKQEVDFFDADLHVKDVRAQQAKSISKGRLMYIETAYLRNDEFTGNDGTKKSRIKLQIVTYELLNDRVENEKKAPAVTQKVSHKLSIHPSDLPPPMNMPKKEKFIEAPIEEEALEVADKTSEENPPF